MAKQPQRRPATPQPKRPAPAAPVRKKEPRESLFSAGRNEFIFDRDNFIIMGVGLALVLLGLLTMAGGAMPDPETWDPNIIYSFRRITLAPILMVAGFVVVTVGIFKKAKTNHSADSNNTPTA
jgi:predicted cobalt transporter CbtA